MASSENKEEAVCVTGGNGFIRSWVVKTLLEQGYTCIHMSILPGSDASHLFKFPGASSATLIVFKVDILDARAVENYRDVFHLASPNTLEEPKDPQTEIVLHAVQGTIYVLQAASRFGVRRVVFTSSITALVPSPSWPSHQPFDETSWINLDYCKAHHVTTLANQT